MYTYLPGIKLYWTEWESLQSKHAEGCVVAVWQGRQKKLWLTEAKLLRSYHGEEQPKA